MFGQKTNSTLISIGNETFDKFLGGGFLNSSLNLFERQGPSSKLLDSVWNKSFAASTLTSQSHLIHVNFNTLTDTTHDQFIASLPTPRKVKSDLLYKDIRGISATAKIKIAWRYSSRSASPTDNTLKVNQIDFGFPLEIAVLQVDRDPIGKIRLIDVKEDFTTAKFFAQLEEELEALKKDGTTVNIIIKDILHPFSPMINDSGQLCRFMYALRCLSRTISKGAILVSYDTDMCIEHNKIKQQLYNMADSVVSFYSYETGQNRLIGYKNTDGTLDYVKVPKINTFGPHFQRELSDWGYRLTRNHRFFVIDELSLPPCHDDDEEDNKFKKQSASDIANIGHKSRPLKKVGPLEDFREVAEDVLAKRL